MMRKQKMKIKLIVDGGIMKPGPAVAQQLGPMGVNLGKVIEDINKRTEGFKGMKVPVELDVDPSTKDFTIEVFSPPIAELIKKELGIEKASGESGKTWAGNIAFETLLGIAKTKMPDLLARDLKSAVRLAIGTCTSMGIMIDSKGPIEIGEDVGEGKYDKEIQEEKTEVSVDKKKELDIYWNQISSEQDKKKKADEVAKAAEEAKKTEEATSGEAEKKEEGEKKAEDKKE